LIKLAQITTFSPSQAFISGRILFPALEKPSPTPHPLTIAVRNDTNAYKKFDLPHSGMGIHEPLFRNLLEVPYFKHQ